MESAQQTAAKYGCKYYDVSAKMDINIQECMKDIFEQSTNIKYGEAKPEAPRQKSFKLKDSKSVAKETKKKGCGC